MENRISGAPVGARAGGRQLGTWADHPVGAGEEALHQVACGRERRRAAVQAPEQPLHQRARHLRRDEPLGGRMEGAHVERARVAQRGAGRAGRERLVHVNEVELRRLQQRLDRARHVQGQRHRATAPERQALAHADHARTALVREDRAGVSRRGLDPVATLADQLTRVRRRDDRHPVPAFAELVGEPLHVAVDLVVHLPRVRRDLGDREALRHGAEHTPGAAPGPFSVARERRRAALVAARRDAARLLRRL